MRNKIVLGILVVCAALIVILATGFATPKNQPAPISDVIRTEPIPPSLVPPPQETCKVSRGVVSTSTWKTFADPRLEITFQYPPTWTLRNGKDSSGEPTVDVEGEGN